MFDEIFTTMQTPTPIKLSGNKFYLPKDVNLKSNIAKKQRISVASNKMQSLSPQALRISNQYELGSNLKNSTIKMQSIKPNKSNKRANLHKMQLKAIRNSNN